ncbi:carbohydrate-binding module family 32 protein [Viridothelium virens]|uniref:alpha,alpha-trehalase n=1 Tax=Viridothelium virens TaxID=1048519 RepID=A0A6A6HDK1_VIRVR|nr:carbohydrate-binding module family 32 protein [Viridothelium virens]
MYSLLLFHLLVISFSVFEVHATQRPSASSASTPQHHYKTRFPGASWDDNEWSITTTTLEQGHYQSRISLANGYLGINVAAVGPLFERDTPVDGDDIEGWPLFNSRQSFATVAGFYDFQPTTNGSNFPWLNQYGGESVVSGIVHFGGLAVIANGNVLNASVKPEQISNFSSTMNFRTGTKTWDYVWTPPGGPGIHVEFSIFVHKLFVNQAVVQLRLTAEQNVNVTIVDILNGDSAVRTDFVDKAAEEDTQTIWSAVRPNGISNVTAYVYSTLKGDGCLDRLTWSQVEDGNIIGHNQSSIGQSITVALSSRHTSTIEKYVGAASNDAYEDPQAVACNASTSGALVGYQALHDSHNQEWATIINEDSTDSFRYPGNGSLLDNQDLVDEQIQAITSSYYLLENTVGPNAVAAAGNNQKLTINSIPVCGLGSDCYGGLIFWDAEVWMSPGLVLAHPEASKQIPQYRVAKFSQAQENIDTIFTSSQKDKSGEFVEAAIYPWTSGRFGNCTGTGPCFDYEYHINGDIGLSFRNYWLASGDTSYFRNELFPVYDGIAAFYSTLLSYNGTSGMYELYNATDPDEYANNVDNPGYTMVLIKDHLTMAIAFRERFGLPVNETWRDQIGKIFVPIDNQASLILEYTGMNGTISVKQADVVLIDDLLDYPNQYSLADLDYYAGKQSTDGPGMTYSVFSIVANLFSISGCSTYTYWLYGSLPYARGPWYQYSEQLVDDYDANGGTHPAFPFLTGMGGALRVAPYGYLGLELVDTSFSINPNLPPQIPYLKYRTIYWSGWPIQATSNQSHTTLERLTGGLSTANASFAENPIPVTVTGRTQNYSLHWNETVVVPNREYSQQKTVPGNIAQCQPVSSTSQYQPGQSPLAAVDGAISTHWAPAYANITSSITVQILQDKAYLITGFSIDWAQAVARQFTISTSNLSNPSAGESVVVTSSDRVAISIPYGSVDQNAVVPYMSNSTNVTLAEPVWSGRFVTLSVKGNQATPFDNGTGPTVAEFAIIAGGTKVPLRYHA